MKIDFDSPIDEGELLRKSVTIDHAIIYPDQFVLNFKGGYSKVIPIIGLSDEDLEAHAKWVEMIGRNIKAEYETGEVTARLAGKVEMARLEAQKAEKVALEAISVLDEVENIN